MVTLQLFNEITSFIEFRNGVGVSDVVEHSSFFAGHERQKFHWRCLSTSPLQIRKRKKLNSSPPTTDDGFTFPRKTAKNVNEQSTSFFSTVKNKFHGLPAEDIDVEFESENFTKRKNTCLHYKRSASWVDRVHRKRGIDYHA